jgi:hypothetical protein
LSQLIFLVSARTNKRHHHHHGQEIKGAKAERSDDVFAGCTTTEQN